MGTDAWGGLARWGGAEDALARCRQRRAHRRRAPPSGVSARGRQPPGETELYVQSGDLRVGDTLRGRGYYEYNPPGIAQEPWICDAGAELLFIDRTGTPDFIPGAGGTTAGRVQLDTDAMPWQVTPVEGPPPGICVKMLRAVEETGEFAALVSNVPRFDYPKLEFHDCIEEIYCMSGDIWLGNSGTLNPGSYIWRPPYITHGPVYSETGCLFYLWCDETLINHFVDDPRLTREDNYRSLQAGAANGGS